MQRALPAIRADLGMTLQSRGHEKSFQRAFRLILGLASTVAANAQLGTALRVQSPSNLR
jgi:hypothetical protein